MPDAPHPPAVPTDAPGAAVVTSASRWRAGRWWALAALALTALAVGLFQATRPPAAPPPAAVAAATPAGYTGGAACAGCHAKEHAAWTGSHHDRAMATATDATVLGRFADTPFRHAGVTSTFFKRDGRFFVRTDGPGGTMGDHEIKYTFGVEPLQQYLVELPGGRLQALGIAWDSRPAAKGGQRWFHLYPGQTLKAGDPLHWTGIDQTWNYQCADCHSTNLRKQYDEKSDTYATTWTDINVTCEACHGPGSSHVAWARQDEAARQRDATRGLTVALDERRDVRWTIDAQTGNAVRSAPRQSSREIETCARCHARRGQFSDTWHAGNRLADGFRASLIEPGLYHPDGQMRDEVFNHGSFLGSRMHAQGVTCSDCHDPHTQKTRLPGNAVCSQCHAPVKYDATEHHRHATGTPGAQCAACHMPTTTYMVVDPRHDHSFRIPRPDRTVTLGVPNACNACHADRTATWAADAIRSWYPNPQPGFQGFAEAFAAADRGRPGTAPALLALVGNAAQPGLVRASAVQRLGRQLTPAMVPALKAALADGDALVRAAAAEALSGIDIDARVAALAPLLADPTRQVRMAAAIALAGEPQSRLVGAQRDAFATAIADYEAAARFNADRPEGRTTLANLYALQGRDEEAVAAYRGAIALDPTFVQAAMNLADFYRSRGVESESEAVLRQSLARNPRSAPLHFSLGLALSRQQRRDDALKALAQAVTLAPDSVRFSHVYAIALNDFGQRRQALAALDSALVRHPLDRDLLLTAAAYERDAGRTDRALAHARRLVATDPADAQAQQLLRELNGAAR